MRQDEPRSFEGPLLVDVADAGLVKALADHLNVEPSDIQEAVDEVGPNLTAVELWLTMPTP